MIANAANALEAALGTLDTCGLLLLSDAKLPSVVGMIVGEPIHSSWWEHPLGGVIYHTSNALEDHPDVLSTKLVGAKVTYVHRRLWPALLGVSKAREPWQLDALSPGARWLLGQVDAAGEIPTNAAYIERLNRTPVRGAGGAIPPGGVQRKKLPDYARDLERRLLVHATEIHTPSGAHAKVLETWQHWATRVEFGASTLKAQDGKRQLEEAATRLAGMTGVRAPLPWRQ